MGALTPGVHRAPMRARDRPEVPSGAGAAFGLRHGLVGIGGWLVPPPSTLPEAVLALTATDGARVARRLARFAALPLGDLVWTRDVDGAFRVGRITGPWRYVTAPAADGCGIHHVRPTEWAPRAVPHDAVPAAVLAAFARGGLNLQRIRAADPAASEICRRRAGGDVSS